MNRDEVMALMQQSATEKPLAIEVKGWGILHVRHLTVADVAEQAEQGADAAKADKTALARGVARLLCDENGKQLFDPKNEADIALLMAQPWKLLKQVLAASDEYEVEQVEGN